MQNRCAGFEAGGERPKCLHFFLQLEPPGQAIEDHADSPRCLLSPVHGRILREIFLDLAIHSSNRLWVNRLAIDHCESNTKTLVAWGSGLEHLEPLRQTDTNGTVH